MQDMKLRFTYLLYLHIFRVQHVIHVVDQYRHRHTT